VITALTIIAWIIAIILVIYVAAVVIIGVVAAVRILTVSHKRRKRLKDVRYRVNIQGPAFMALEHRTGVQNRLKVA
jgi:4-hydroxybenzoate polyprenyltransferase